jgi:hypothetical protein
MVVEVALFVQTRNRVQQVEVNLPLENGAHTPIIKLLLYAAQPIRVSQTALD